MSVIRSVEAFVLRLGKDDGGAARYISAPPVRSVYPSREETLFVRIATDDHVGWGEALTPVAPEAPAAVITHLFAPLLVGTDLAATGVRPVTTLLQASMRERGHLGGHHADAVAGVDIALWDLFGQIHRLPVHQLLGGAYRTEVPLYLTSVAGATPPERAEQAAAARADGFTRMKLHLTTEPRRALETVDAVLGALDDPDAKVAVDAHWVHGQGAASRLGRALDERGAWFFEAPLAPEDLPGHSALAAMLATPVAVGEAMRHRFEFAQWAG
ncbi:MAG TPA: enolase C-terminal domain-like protein, partial [Streptosporangiaceae bacterium]|nr:enolase C-terminal domain-like protein [Streptosporangiaceae bacterium]